MIDCEFLEESWKPRQKQANMVRTLHCFGVDVSSTGARSHGTLRTDTIKVVMDKALKCRSWSWPFEERVRL